MKKLLLNVHLCLGLVAAVFLVILSVSGAIIAFEDEINRALNPGMLRVQPLGQRLSWDEVRTRVEQQEPGWRLIRLYLPQHDDDSLYVRLRSARDHRIKHFYVNQYTGRVLGSTDDGNRFTWIAHDLHVKLVSLPGGNSVVVAATLGLLALSISGIILWWPRKVFTPKGATLARFNNDLHRSLGFWSFLAMLIFAVTGLLLHYQGEGKLLALMNAKAAPVDSPGHGPSIEGLLQSAGEAAPGARIMRIMLAVNQGDLVLVQAAYPEDHTPAGRTYINLDPASGRPLTVSSSRNSPLFYTIVVQWNRELHTGTLLGTPTKILVSILSLLLAVLAITGPMIWVNKQLAAARGRRAVQQRARSA
ncbi:MAG: PepSY-associated TM helix domain-containing protein [Terriglobales bacterium]